MTIPVNLGRPINVKFLEVKEQAHALIRSQEGCGAVEGFVVAVRKVDRLIGVDIDTLAALDQVGQVTAMVYHVDRHILHTLS